MNSHNVLREDGPDLVVAADFAAAGRPTASFPELVALLESPATYWETAPPPYGEEVGMSGEDHLNRWLEDIRGSGRRVAAVLGFCSGSVYAGNMARALTDWQGEAPGLILLDAEKSSQTAVREHFERFARVRMGPLLAPEEVENLVLAARHADDQVASPTALVGELARLSDDVVRPGFVSTGFSEVRCDEFIALFVAYLYWLAGAAELPQYHGWETAQVIEASTDGVGIKTIGERPEVLVAGITELDVAHLDLMRSRDTARVVDSFLERHVSTRAHSCPS